MPTPEFCDTSTKQHKLWIKPAMIADLNFQFWRKKSPVKKFQETDDSNPGSLDQETWKPS